MPLWQSSPGPFRRQSLPGRETAFLPSPGDDIDAQPLPPLSGSRHCLQNSLFYNGGIVPCLDGPF